MSTLKQAQTYLESIFFRGMIKLKVKYNSNSITRALNFLNY